MKKLISEADLEAGKAAARRDTWILRGIIAVSLILVTVLCLLTRTVNAREMAGAVIGSMILTGWVCMGWYMGRVLPGRAKAHHLKTLAEGETKTYEGWIFLTGAPEKIPKSVWIRRVTLEGEKSPDAAEDIPRKRLSLDESLTDRMPEDGSRVRVETVHGYITGIEAAEEKTGEASGMTGRKKAPRFRRLCSRAAYLLPLYLLWAVAAVVIGGFIVTRITDAAPRNKLVIYADCGVRRTAELADRLEKQLDDPIRMVQVRSFDYALFQESGILSADLYIVPLSRAAEYMDRFAPLPGEPGTWEDPLIMDGRPYGIPLWVPAEGIRAAADYFVYDAEEAYYLFFGAVSLHLTGNKDAVDNQAADAAEYLLDTK